MKHLFYLVMFALVLSLAPGNARAGFVVKARSATAVSGSSALTTSPEKTFTARPVMQQLSSLMGRQPQTQNEWYGIAAMIAATLGLLVPGLSLLAVLFGVLGMGRRCKAPGLAVAGFVIGIAEIVIFLVASTTFFGLILF